MNASPKRGGAFSGGSAPTRSELCLLPQTLIAKISPACQGKTRQVRSLPNAQCTRRCSSSRGLRRFGELYSLLATVCGAALLSSTRALTFWIFDSCSFSRATTVSICFCCFSICFCCCAIVDFNSAIVACCFSTFRFSMVCLAASGMAWGWMRWGENAPGSLAAVNVPNLPSESINTKAAVAAETGAP